MAISKYDKLAKILVNYSTRVKEEDNVLINMGGTESLPLVQAVKREVIKKGATAEVLYGDTQMARDLFKYGTNKQLGAVPKLYAQAIEWADVWLGLAAVGNPFELTQFSPVKTALRAKVSGKLAHRRVEKCRWVICLVPTVSFAQKAGISREEIENFFFRATLRDWAKEAREYQRLAKIFQKSTRVRLKGKKTDLTFSTTGMRYVVDGGENNMPGGEIFTAPVKTSVQGQVFFEFPALRGGKVIKDIYLEFSKGKVIKAQASEGQPTLLKALEMDSGARFLGEFGLGLNYGIKRFTFETLFDEKIGGTIHLALGNAYPECNGKNKSALHWDLVKDTRKQGEIWIDDKKVMEKGRYVI